MELRGLTLQRLTAVVWPKHSMFHVKPLSPNVSAVRLNGRWCVRLLFRRSTRRKTIERRWVATWWHTASRALCTPYAARSPVWG